MKIFSRTLPADVLRLAACASIAVLLAACGGGGGSPGTTSGGGTPGTPGTPGGTTTDPTLTVTVKDGSGADLGSLSGGQEGIVRAKLVNAAGAAVPNAIVKFSTSDTSLLTFNPASGSALTDANGVATVNVKPTSTTSAGAARVQADSEAGGRTATGSINLSVGAAPLTVGALSFNPAPAGSLPAFSTVALNIPVSSGGRPASEVTGLSLTSLCKGDGLADIVLGSLANGVQSATYTNKGCLRVNDRITASIGSSTQSIDLRVDAANIGAIQFVGSDLADAAIVLKGSGGQGRKESALLTFRVLDQNNAGLAGVDVNFSATTLTGGLTVAPLKGTTDANGNVTTTVSSGTIPTPVRVIAEATRNGRTINGLSDTLTVSTGLPIQRSMSLSVSSYNIDGWNHDNQTATVSVLLADQYGNPIADGTAVNFIAEGGAIGSSARGACTTTNGGCSVQVRSQAFRPANGRVSVLAYVQGVEDFVDSNGDGQYSCTNFVDSTGKVPAVYRPLVDTCLSGGEPFTDQGDPFLDAGLLGSMFGLDAQGVVHSLDQTYTAANGDLPVPYNRTTYSAAGDGKWGINYIRAQTEITFSNGEDMRLVRVSCDNNGVCTDMPIAPLVVAGLEGASCATRELLFRLYDSNNNPLPHNTTITAVDADKLTPQTISLSQVPSTNRIGGTIHKMTIKPDSACAKGSFGLKLTAPQGGAVVVPVVSAP